MPLSQRTKVFIAIGSFILLTIVLIGTVAVTHYNAGIIQNCPAEVQKCNGTNELFHMNSGRCIQSERSGGICGGNMLISPVTTCRMQGECECDYENNNRHLLYDGSTDQCYFIYSQGPCEDGYIVMPSRNGTRLNCTRDICFDQKAEVSGEERDAIVPFRNKCYPLFTNLNVPGCTGKLKFWKEQLYPSCHPPAISLTGSFGGKLALKCEPGSRKAARGGCQAMVGITWEKDSINSLDPEDCIVKTFT